MRKLQSPRWYVDWLIWKLRLGPSPSVADLKRSVVPFYCGECGVTFKNRSKFNAHSHEDPYYAKRVAERRATSAAVAERTTPAVEKVQSP